MVLKFKSIFETGSNNSLSDDLQLYDSKIESAYF